ncbi:DUF3142 domain-containing protein [Commensalibacter nepenthis]|uniref:DUF3142 domain-containing protein n=1 Tax=Commensalibacter nepenthis TaxID=3043872 RepID=A0ABT6Q5K4_9PROT|nr:DUF3142 domain-containing protein [Commensalibacter sp. TBRC 10068]MDI2112181.1 DUF3142 domain-containing protein [Commensalibacter sp. TBRC 10068]
MIQIFCIYLLLCLTHSTHNHHILPQEAYIWQKKWNNSLKPAIEQTMPFITGWRFLAGESEPDGQVIYPSIEFNILQQSHLPLTAVYRFDRLRPLPSVDEVLTLIQQSPAYQTHHIHHIELDLDWPTSKLPIYIQLLRSLKTKLPQDVQLNITMIPDWMRSPVFPELTEQIPYPVLQVHSVDNPQTGLFNDEAALAYIRKMDHLTHHPFYIALPTYGLKIQATPSGTIYAIEGENDFKTGHSGQELYSDPQQVRNLINKLQQNTPTNLKGIVWFRLPIVSDQRNWSHDTWMAMIRHQPLKGQIIVQEIPDSNNPGAIKIMLFNQGNIALPLPPMVPLRCHIADGLFPYQLSLNNQGKYMLNLIKQVAPLNTHQERVIGWMRCD